MNRAVFPGSFDPITLGHLDVIKRAIPFFDEIIIAIGINHEKRYLFSLEKRIQFVETTFKNDSKIKVLTYKGLTIDFCKKKNINLILRGLRNLSDFEFEKTIAHANKKLSEIDTFFILTSPDYSYISSSIVRDIISNNGDYRSFVPDSVRL
jgi:pantetheine-phosphate adenylyltransferase